MEQVIMAILTLAVVLVVRRKEALRLRWAPNRYTWAAIGTGLLAFALSASLLVVPRGALAGRIIHFGLIYVLCGFILPWGILLWEGKGKGLAGMGAGRERWLPSLLINLALGGLFSLLILFQADLQAMDWGQFGRAVVVLSGAGGLFELFLYYGLIHLRLEKAFGMLPAILLTSLMYVSWHTGTQLPMEPDLWAGVLKLLAVGVMYQSVFSLTRHLLVIWPFFHAAGVMIDFTINIGDLQTVSQALPWALATLAGMALSALALAWLAKRRGILFFEAQSTPAARG